MFFYVVDSKMSSILTHDCILFSGETDPKERLARQRKQLQKKLGLDMGAAIGMDTEELFNDEDLEDACASSTNRSQPGKSLGCHFSATIWWVVLESLTNAKRFRKLTVLKD